MPQMYDGRALKNKMIQLFGTDNGIFEKSFYITGVGYPCSNIMLLYDKKSDKLIQHHIVGCTGLPN